MSQLDIPMGVGQTAVFIAWQRHAESQKPDALFRDPLAALLLNELAETPTLAHVREVARRANAPQYFAVRTRYFDDGLQAAMRAGLLQVVTLAAGLDGRTARLDCPPGTRWFELDLPEMIQFKAALLQSRGLPLHCEWRPVAADLRSDWPSALLEAGFDAEKPTAWLIEGLLMYLSAEEGDTVLQRVTELSAPGSRLFLEQLQELMMSEEGRAARALVESQGARWLSAKDDLVPWLDGMGWSATQYSGDDLSIGHGRSVSKIPACWVASATLRDKGVRPA